MPDATRHPLERTRAVAEGGRIVVGVADFGAVRVTQAVRSASIMTFALGSCIGLTAWDPVARVGALLHVLLPDSRSSPDRARAHPAMYADSGFAALLRRVVELGAEVPRLILCAAGGAEILRDDGQFRIGQLNRDAMVAAIAKSRLSLAAEETGGSRGRTMVLSLADGLVSVRTGGKESTLWAA